MRGGAGERVAPDVLRDALAADVSGGLPELPELIRRCLVGLVVLVDPHAASCRAVLTLGADGRGESGKVLAEDLELNGAGERPGAGVECRRRPAGTHDLLKLLQAVRAASFPPAFKGVLVRMVVRHSDAVNLFEQRRGTLRALLELVGRPHAGSGG